MAARTIEQQPSGTSRGPVPDASTVTLLHQLGGYISSAKRAAMELKGHGLATIKEPRLLFGRKHYLFLLSHMRCYTSLLGHVLGNHADIAGSYECHQSYRNRLDLVKTRYLVYYNHNKKIGNKYIFDKLLHDRYTISTGILNRDNVRVIFALRDPAQTIPSIVKLYSGQGLQDAGWYDYRNPDQACEYYIRRLQSLEGYSRALRGKPIYFDGEDLNEHTDRLFEFLRRELELSGALTEVYATYNHTGRPGFGDTSNRLNSGRIDRQKSDFGEIEVPEGLMRQARDAYDSCRSLLLKRCVCP
jgi:hypothetical protein